MECSINESFEEESEVESIITRRLFLGAIIDQDYKHLLKWKGYPMEDNTLAKYYP